jgi:hypothetical protein
MDETSGTTLADSSGNSRDMTLVGSATLGATKISSDAAGANRSIEFSSPGNYLRRTASDSVLANLVDNFTIGGWLRYTTTQPENSTMLLGREYDGSTVPWALVYNRDNAWGARWGFGIYNGAWRDCVFHYDNDWRGQDLFLVGTFGGGTMRFYLNGALCAVTTGIAPASVQPATTKTIIGRKWDEGGGGFAGFGGFGRVDDAFVMDEVLTARQIRELYQDMAQITGTIPSASEAPQGDFLGGGWTLNNFAAAASSSSMQVAYAAFPGSGRSAFWADPLAIDGYSFEWKSDMTAANGGVGLSFRPNSPFTDWTTSGGFHWWGVLGGAYGFVADRDGGLFRAVRHNNGLDNSYDASFADASLSGVITWKATFTKAATNRFTVTLLKNGSAYTTFTDLDMQAETFYVGVTGGNPGSGGIDGFVKDFVVTAPTPPTPPPAAFRLRRPLGFAARRRAVA